MVDVHIHNVHPVAVLSVENATHTHTHTHLVQVPEETLTIDSGPTDVVRGPPTDEVLDLRQRLTILQQKRADDKARIKELEKFKLQFMQVNVL